MIFNPLFIVMENRLMMKRAVFFARYFEYNKRKRREEYKRHVAGYIYILMQSWKKEKDCSYQFHLCNNIYKWIQIQIITLYDLSFLFFHRLIFVLYNRNLENTCSWTISLILRTIFWKTNIQFVSHARKLKPPINLTLLST